MTMRVRRIVVRVLGVLVVLALLVSAYVVVQVSREVSSLLRVSATLWPSQVRITDAEQDRVAFEVVEDGPTWLTSGEIFGLDWETGSGHVGEVLSDDGDRVVRTLRLLEGELPAPGTLARYTRDAYPRDARRAFPARAVREVEIASGDERLPAWFAPGAAGPAGDTWAVLVHGRGATRAETFRLMHSTVDAGMPSLAITYRGAPEVGGGRAGIGISEWRDLEAAVALARERGAERVVLLGASMGGAIIASFLERSAYADGVEAIVLDSPLLDFRTAVDQAVAGVGVPGFLTSAGLRLAQWRTGVDLDRADYLDDTSWVTMPALVVHGTSDGSVPLETSRQLAEAVPEQVTVESFTGAGHLESWNSEPRRYDRLVREFLRAHAGRPRELPGPGGRS